MTTRLAAIVHRRRELVAHARVQRAELAALTERWRTPLAVADTAYRVARALGRHGAFAALALALVARSGSPRLLAWSGRLLTVWEVARALRGLRPALDRD